MLKDALQYVPLFGWYFYIHGCVYVRRGRGKFREDITRNEMKYLVNTLNRPFWLVIFPEGTRFVFLFLVCVCVFNQLKYSNSCRYVPDDRKQIERSQASSTLINRLPLAHVRAPHSTGTLMALDEMRTKLDAIYDVTVVYSRSRASDGQHLKVCACVCVNS
jgi:lysophosphatidate acyltransferase